MYYICKFSESWLLYDANKQSSRQLDKLEVDCLRKLFPSLLEENRILTAFEVNSVQPNKLLKLSVNDKNSNSKDVGKDLPKANV